MLTRKEVSDSKNAKHLFFPFPFLSAQKLRKKYEIVEFLIGEGGTGVGVKSLSFSKIQRESPKILSEFFYA